MKVIAITQQKGGTGKTTTAAAIGSGLIHKGNRVLFIDLDPQGNLSFILRSDTAKANSLDLLTGNITARKAAQTLTMGDKGTAAIIPATPYLSGADAKISITGREYRLAETLKQVSGLYDYCIVDTPPALGILTVNALAAADSVIIPCQADILSIQATGQIAETINGVRSNCNPKLKIAGILLTRYIGRQNLTKDTTEVLETAAKAIGTKLFNTRIRESVSIREAQAIGKDIFSFNPRCNGAADYTALLNEIAEQNI